VSEARVPAAGAAAAAPDLKRVRAIIHGRVQGVNFRHFARLEAEARGVKGYVRNCDDGTVEVLAQGRPGDVDAFLAWLRRGPRLARVSRVEAVALAPADGLASFEVRG
jgi:acylphosphatase